MTAISDVKLDRSKIFIPGHHQGNTTMNLDFRYQIYDDSRSRLVGTSKHVGSKVMYPVRAIIQST